MPNASRQAPMTDGLAAPGGTLASQFLNSKAPIASAIQLAEPRKKLRQFGPVDPVGLRRTSRSQSATPASTRKTKNGLNAALKLSTPRLTAIPIRAPTRTVKAFTAPQTFHRAMSRVQTSPTPSTARQQTTAETPGPLSDRSRVQRRLPPGDPFPSAM